MSVHVKIKSSEHMSDDELINSILQSRGVSDMERFLYPPESDILPADDLPNIEKASDIIIDCIKNQRHVYVNADSDTDGVMSGAIMIRWLKQQGLEVNHHINKGKSHGTDEELIEDLRLVQPDVLIMVDSLDSDLDNYRIISEDLGIKIIVLDHHDAEDMEVYKPYITLVTSNQNYANPDLSGAGVVWKFCEYLDSELGISEAVDFVDMAAVGILADVMDVTNPDNRAIISMGLSHSVNPALKRICRGFGFNSSSVLFSIAPLINAACRYEQNELALQLFLSDKEPEIRSILKSLEKFKDRQKKDIDGLSPQLENQIKAQSGSKFLFLTCDTEFGIKGLMANQIANKYKKPTIVVGLAKYTNGTRYAGSARCPIDLDFRSKCNDTQLCSAKGHAQAFGIDLKVANASQFRKQLEESLDIESTDKVIEVDAEVDVSRFTYEFIQKVKKIDHITGKNFKPLNFLVKLNDFEADTMTQGKHLCCSKGDFKFIKWNAGDLVDDLLWSSFNGNDVTFIGTLDQGFFGRNFVRRMIIDQYIIED